MEIVQTEKAPKAIGPYSQAVIAGDFVFCSGQIPIDPDSGELVAGRIKEQTARVLSNLGEVLLGAGVGFDAVTSVNVYLRDMDDFKGMNEVYAEIFGEHKPARITVGVSALPKNALIEISCTAYKSK